MREINYKDVLRTIDEAINAQEWSAQRSAGKVKQCVHDLNALYEYRERVEKKTKKVIPAKKEG